MAAKNQIAADVGARVLTEGGNAVDAAICAALSLATLEPWTSGLGSAGCMTIWDQHKRRGHVIDFPAALPIDSGALEAAQSAAANHAEQGAIAKAYASIAVPGHLDGLWAAHAFGAKSWPALVGPAVELSEEGLEVDWYAFLVVSAAASQLERFPRSRELFFPVHLSTAYLHANSGNRIRNPALTGVLRLLAERGARDFYEGLVAHAIVEDLKRGGSAISKADLRSYRARAVEPTSFSRHGKRFLLKHEGIVSELFCSLMSADDSLRPNVLGGDAVNLAHAMSAAHAELHLSADELNEWSSHIAVIDRDGNMVSLSQSLGSLFGSKIVLPTTGILANNYGVRARARRPNDEKDRLVEHHLLPVLGLSGDKAWLAVGVSGSRHILGPLVQLLSFVTDQGFSLEDAFNQPRINITRDGRILIDVSAPPETRRSLQQIFGGIEVPQAPQPFVRPCAIAVTIDPFSGEHVAMTEVTELWAGAAVAT